MLKINCVCACSIEDKYSSLGGPSGFLGSPLESENYCPDRIGKYRGFTHGSIHWNPAGGAYETHGPIREKWSQSGWEAGPLGYPISDEMDWAAYDLWDMLPTDYIKWTYPEFELGLWLDKEIIHSDFEKLGRWSKFEHGCITWWQNIQPPKESDVWIWLKAGQYYIPKLGKALPNYSRSKISKKARLGEDRDKINELLRAQVVELHEKVKGIVESSTQTTKLLTQSECRLLDEMMNLRDGIEALQTGTVQADESLSGMKNNIISLRDEVVTLQSKTSQAEQELSRALLSKVLNDVKSMGQIRRTRLISYAALIMGIVAVIVACIRCL